MRHSWWGDPAGGHEVPSRKSCCLKVPSSLALHTTLGFPTSTCKYQATMFWVSNVGTNLANKKCPLDSIYFHVKNLTANFFTLLVWHWYNAYGDIELSSGPLPLNRDKLNNRTCKIISNCITLQKFELKLTALIKEIAIIRRLLLHLLLQIPQAHQKFRGQILYRICLHNARSP